MLGPELLSLSSRVAPLFSEGAPTLRLDRSVSADLGLTNFQVVKGVISANAGQLFLNTQGFNQSIVLPDYFRRWLGRTLAFSVSRAVDGSHQLKPISLHAIDTEKPSSSLPSQRPTTSLFALLMDSSLRGGIPTGMQTDLATFDHKFVPSQSIRQQLTNLQGIFAKTGLLKSSSIGVNSASWPSLLLRLLRVQDPQISQIAKVLLQDFLARAERLSNAQRHDVILLDVLLWLNGTPIELSLQRGSSNDVQEESQKWIVNMYVRFRENSEIWLRAEHSAEKSDLHLTAWLTDAELYNTARGSQETLETEVLAFGLNLVGFSVVNAARDNVCTNEKATNDRKSKSLNSVDLSV